MQTFVRKFFKKILTSNKCSVIVRVENTNTCSKRGGITMTEAKYLGRISPILADDWTDNVPSYYSYTEFYNKRKAAKKQLKKERRVFFTVCALLVCFCMSYFTISSHSSESYVNCPSHAVAYGETLWSIANEYKDDDMSTGELIYKIKKVNDLESSAISAGDVLIIPVENV